jgi:hypothetical protein
MRTPNDICLLCDTNKAIKENSHIIPKFIGKTLLNDGGTNRGYILDTSRGHLPADVIQDIAKENYLLCPDCESYFSIIETYIAERLHKRLWTVRLADQFPFYENGGGVNWKVCAQIDPNIFRLFIYSIIWRCSISQIRLHSEFKLTEDEENLLKKNLQMFISATHKEFIFKVERKGTNVSIYPFVIYTAQTFPNKTSNVIYTSTHNRNPYVLYLNEYILLFSFTKNDMMERFDFLVNDDSSLIKIGFFSEEFWKSENKRFYDQTLDIMSKKTKAAGKELYIDPKFRKD